MMTTARGGEGYSIRGLSKRRTEMTRERERKKGEGRKRKK